MLVKVLDIYFAALWISKYQIIIRYFYNVHCALNTPALQMYTLYRCISKWLKTSMMCIKIMVMCMYFTHSKVENKQLCFQEYILNHNVYTGYKESWFFSLPFVQFGAFFF